MRSKRISPIPAHNSDTDPLISIPIKRENVSPSAITSFSIQATTSLCVERCHRDPKKLGRYPNIRTRRLPFQFWGRSRSLAYSVSWTVLYQITQHHQVDRVSTDVTGESPIVHLFPGGIGIVSTEDWHLVRIDWLWTNNSPEKYQKSIYNGRTRHIYRVSPTLVIIPTTRRSRRWLWHSNVCPFSRKHI